MKNDEQYFALLMEKIAEVHRSLLWETAKTNKISPIQIQVMIFLDSRDLVDTSIKIISQYFNLKAPTISESIKSLLEKEYVYMYICGKDKRKHCYKLTPSGKIKVNEIRAWNHPLINIFNEMNAKTQENILNNLHHLMLQIQSKQIISGVSNCRDCIYYDMPNNTCSQSKRISQNFFPPINCRLFVEK